ncbi:MAG: PilZ domain-containing protein [Gammaproteobacteria bacterium]|nr:PilZ domain-containing protein [Gammaproteobacteria bacterium]
MNIKYNHSLLVNNILELVKKESQSDEQALKLKNELTNLINNFTNPNSNDQNHEVSILISDIRGFTSMSEQYSANQILQMLNNYFTKMNQIIQKYNGLIDKYMGDAVMVVFGIPKIGEEDAINAIACAIEMQIAMDEVNQYNKNNGYPEIFVGIGINTDKVSAGQLGSEIHNEFTVIGDGVNLTSRIESYSLRGQVLISEYTYHKVQDIIKIGTINEVHVKGKTNAINLYEVIAIEKDGVLLENPNREIRHAIRLSFEQPFDFNILKGKEVIEEVITGIIKDISYNGLFAIIDKKIDMLTNIRFSLALHLIGGKTRDIYAKIVSSRQLPGGYGYGIEFTSLDSESQKSIKLFIDRIIGGM